MVMVQLGEFPTEVELLTMVAEVDQVWQEAQFKLNTKLDQFT